MTVSPMAKVDPAAVEAALDDKDARTSYLRFRDVALLQADPDVRWCPRPGCESPIRGFATVSLGRWS